MQTTSDHFRKPAMLDRLLGELQRALDTVAGPPPRPGRDCPAADLEDAALNPFERRHAAGLMRVNHSGEVCAQALYYGQLLFARDAATRARLQQSADEETDHLAWCRQRLEELGEGPSRLDPLWYAGAFALGALAGAAGDRWSLGFVVETERQVEAHLGEHMVDLPAGDRRSRAIVAQMAVDEAEHGQAAREAGGRELPDPLPTLMRLSAAVMKAIAYRI